MVPVGPQVGSVQFEPAWVNRRRWLGRFTFGKLQQPHRWGTPKWIEAYNHRTAIEGVFGNLKCREQGGIDRKWIRVVGIAATALMLTAATVNHNMKTARHWAEKNLKTNADIYEFETETELRSQIKNDQPRQPNAPPTAA